MVKRGWSGWIPKSEDEKQKFSRGWVDDGQEGCSEVLHERLEGTAAVKATTTATRNKNTFKISDQIRKMAARCKNLALVKALRKKARKARRAFDARVGDPSQK